MKYFTSLLSDEHERAGFSSGEPALDSFLIERVDREVRNGLSKCYVHCAEGTPNVLGYYTLSMHTFQPGVMSKTQGKKIPKGYNVPAALVGRLAVSSAYQGQGIGVGLLLDSFQRAVDLAHIVGIFAVAVDAKNDEALSFYKKYGFIQFKDEPYKLFIPMKTIRGTLEMFC